MTVNYRGIKPVTRRSVMAGSAAVVAPEPMGANEGYRADQAGDPPHSFKE
jgi:hypothetical protein